MTSTRELIGNAARDGDLAWVRLAVFGQRILTATGEGAGMNALCREVEGLTLLEAARVPGERLAADALHDALGPAVTAAPRPERVAVAMSGGVDSAVALLHARDAGHEPVGVTLRLWTDPAGKSSERACCSPASVVAARETCQALGYPHVTLDLREPFRRAVVDPFVRGYARGETPNPCIRCNGGFRFGALLAFARRIGAARLATGHYAQIAEHRGRLLLARGSIRPRTSPTCSRASTRAICARLWFPLGEQRRRRRAPRPSAAGLAAAARPESQEACFLAGDDYRDFLARHGLESREGPVVDRTGGSSPGTQASGASHRASGAASGSPCGEPVYALGHRPAHEHRRRRPRASLARTEVSSGAGRLFVPVERVEAKLRYRSSCDRGDRRAAMPAASG